MPSEPPAESAVLKHDRALLTAAIKPLLIRDTEAAALLGISRAHLHKLRAAGRFVEPIRLGRKLLFDRAELEAWKDARCPDLQTWRAMRAQTRRNLRVV
jgi:excisionase family DNA binding protein